MSPLERATGDPDREPNAASRLLNAIMLPASDHLAPFGWVVRINDSSPLSPDDKVHGPFSDPREANRYRDALEADLHGSGFIDIGLTVLPMYPIDVTVPA